MFRIFCFIIYFYSIIICNKCTQSITSFTMPIIQYSSSVSAPNEVLYQRHSSQTPAYSAPPTQTYSAIAASVPYNAPTYSDNAYSSEISTTRPETDTMSFSFPLPKSFIGPLEPNNLLSQATRLFENVIIGPTSLAIYKDYIYAGTAGGGVYRGNLRTGNATRIAKVSNELCETKPWDASLCGRALGVRVDSTGTLFYVDAYLGLHMVEFIDNKVKLTRLLSLEDVGGKYMGHLVIDEGSGTAGGHVIYITIASAKRDLTQWTAMLIEPDRTGYVVKYDTDSGASEIIWDKLWYPASIELTDDRQALLVPEFAAKRVLKHYIKGSKKGLTEVWAENLPGDVDHLLRSEDKTRETYWMPIVNGRNESSSNLLDWMSDKPYLRQDILNLYYKIGSNIEELGQQYSNERIEKLGFSMKYGNQFYSQNIANNYGLILEMDANGNIIGSIHSTDGTNAFISEALEGASDDPSERVLYIGSFGYKHILKLIVKKPIYDLPVFNTLRSEDGYTGDTKQLPKYAKYTQPLSLDDVRIVNLPTIYKSWRT